MLYLLSLYYDSLLFKDDFWALWPLLHGFTNILISLSSADEIMQLDSSPLRAADITPDLKKQFAFLSGGRGDNGSPIIVFPEFPAFGEITDREFHNVLTYLTSVPRHTLGRWRFTEAAGTHFIMFLSYSSSQPLALYVQHKPASHLSSRKCLRQKSSCSAPPFLLLLLLLLSSQDVNQSESPTVLMIQRRG
uniref:MCF.2 cell line derived transforming sequence like n=1 Tax=Amphiprion percula TaxID=161767 RepID=A0A3P8S7H5_AMPPE